MGRVFISYRRDDSAAICGSMYEWLAKQYGREGLFKDVDDIPLGLDFVDHIQRTIAQSSVELVVIGPRWLNNVDANGQRRLDDPNDFVRIEVESALRGHLPVILVLVEGASLPAADQLPPSLQPLAGMTPIVVRTGDNFSQDMNRLAARIESAVRLRARPGELPYASWGARGAAYLLDGVILLAFMLVPFCVIYVLLLNASINGDSGTVAILYAALYGVIIVGGLLYFARAWARTGQTIGQRALHIKVQRTDGKLLSFGGATLRFLVGMLIVDTLTLYLGFLWPLWDKRRQALHDKVADTVVIATE